MIAYKVTSILLYSVFYCLWPIEVVVVGHGCSHTESYTEYTLHGKQAMKVTTQPTKYGKKSEWIPSTYMSLLDYSKLGKSDYKESWPGCFFLNLPLVISMLTTTEFSSSGFVYKMKMNKNRALIGNLRVQAQITTIRHYV